MLRLVGGKTALAVVTPFLAACSLLVTDVALAASGLLVEPGVPLADGRWLVPVGRIDGQGDVSAPADGELVVFGPGDGELAHATVPFAPVAGGLPMARVVLLEAPAAGIPAGWREVLKAFLEASGPAAPRQVVTTAAAPSYAWGAPAELETVPAAARLWDSVLAAIGLLATPEGMARRVLVLVADGEEELASEHVLVSCVEAAARARVGVHVLVFGPRTSDSAGEARLRELAARSGGSVLVAGADPAGDLERLLSNVDACAGLAIEPPAGAELPSRLDLRTSGLGEVARAEAEVAAPRPLAARSRGRWLVPAAGLVMVAGAGWWLWRRQRRTMGVLLLRTRGGQRRFPVPLSGVSLGTDADNSLVLPSAKVARHHAVIRVREDGLHITDLRSAGGTRVNGQPIRTRRLADGDRILLGGSVEMIYRNGDR